jgi:hypothetical protein
MSADTELIAPLIIAAPIRKKKKMEILHFLRATFPRECGKWKFLTNATFLRTEAPLIQTWQTVKQKQNKQKTVKCLPNLRETLIGFGFGFGVNYGSG